MPIRPYRIVDCLGLFCPLPLVRVTEAIRTMSVGDVLEMMADDPAAEPDMRHWAARTGHTLLEVRKDGAVCRFLVRKTR